MAERMTAGRHGAGEVSQSSTFGSVGSRLCKSGFSSGDTEYPSLYSSLSAASDRDFSVFIYTVKPAKRDSTDKIHVSLSACDASSDRSAYLEDALCAAGLSKWMAYRDGMARRRADD